MGADRQAHEPGARQRHGFLQHLRVFGGARQHRPQARPGPQRDHRGGRRGVRPCEAHQAGCARLVGERRPGGGRGRARGQRQLQEGGRLGAGAPDVHAQHRHLAALRARRRGEEGEHPHLVRPRRQALLARHSGHARHGARHGREPAARHQDRHDPGSFDDALRRIKEGGLVGVLEGQPARPLRHRHARGAPRHAAHRDRFHQGAGREAAPRRTRTTASW